MYHLRQKQDEKKIRHASKTVHYFTITAGPRPILSPFQNCNFYKWTSQKRGRNTPGTSARYISSETPNQPCIVLQIYCCVCACCYAKPVMIHRRYQRPIVRVVRAKKSPFSRFFPIVFGTNISQSVPALWPTYLLTEAGNER